MAGGSGHVRQGRVGPIAGKTQQELGPLRFNEGRRSSIEARTRLSVWPSDQERPVQAECVFEAAGRPAEETVTFIGSWGLELDMAEQSKAT